ncbi:MAG: hypothetical protein K0R17_94 [Rariglobus sp.]|jgi:hypothetical protein|nr:hypothetical protein [Rariglobus sp.]
METIHFTDSPTLEGFYTLNTHVLQPKTRLLRVIGGLLVLTFLLFPLMTRSQPQPPTLFQAYTSQLGLLILPGILICLHILTRYTIKKRWNAAKELREKRSYSINEHGIQVTASSFNGFLEWSLLNHAEVNKGYFFLRTAQNLFYHFPVSAVPDKQNFMELIRTKITNTKNFK